MSTQEKLEDLWRQQSILEYKLDDVKAQIRYRKEEKRALKQEINDIKRAVEQVEKDAANEH